MKLSLMLPMLLVVVIPTKAATIHTAVSCSAEGVYEADLSSCSITEASFGIPISASAQAGQTLSLYSYNARAFTSTRIDFPSGLDRPWTEAEATASLMTSIVTAGPVRDGWMDLDIVLEGVGWETGRLFAAASIGPYSWYQEAGRITDRFAMTLGQPFDISLQSESFLGAPGGTDLPVMILNLALYEADGLTPVAIHEVVIPEPGGTAAGGLLALLLFRRTWGRTEGTSRAETDPCAL